MTKKRFTIKPQDDLFGVVDNYSADKICVINGIRTEIEAGWLCKDMNTLNDENEQLKQSYKEFEEECQSTFNAMSRKQNDLYRKNFKLKEENEQLKQFKEKVFVLFDEEIAKNKEAIEWGEKTGADCGSIGFYNHMLKMLKKELQE